MEISSTNQSIASMMMQQQQQPSASGMASKIISDHGS